MTTLYRGPAVLTLPENVTVDVDVDLWMEQDGPLIQWGGTASTEDPYRLWQEEKDEQRMCTVRVGNEAAGYRVGEGMIIEPSGSSGANAVTLRGSGEFVEFQGD